MKQNIKTGLLSLLGFALLTSCNVMDTQPFESYDEDLVWGSKSTIDAFIFETYNHSVAIYAGGFPGSEGWTPNGIKSDLSNTDNFPLERIDRYYDSGFNRFGALRRCNMIIEKGGASEGLSEIQKKEVVAEGHMLRGLIFYNQTQKMGRFIPIKKVLSPTDSMDFKTPLTKDLAESYTLVMSDFDKAIEGLPEVSASGRLNKFAALAYKSEAALQAYAYTKDTKYLDMAIEASTLIIESGKYQIDENYGDMFLAAGRFSPEIILGYYRLDQNTSFSSFQELINVVPNIKNDEVKGVQGSPLFKNANGMTFEGWATYFPTQDMVDQYLTIDEVTGEAKPWDQTTQFKKSVRDDLANLTLGCFTKIATNVPSEEDLSGVNAKGPILNKAGKVIDNANISELMYNNRDKRFYSTIVYDSCRWFQDEIITTCCQGNAWAAVRKGLGAPQDDSWYTTATGYYWRKSAYEPKPRAFHSAKTDFHLVLKRLGEIYLNRAEAYLLKGDIASAVADLNVTRVKHGGLPASVAANMEEAWADYMRERRVDMAMEGDMYHTYLRWGKYGGYANNGKAPGEAIVALNKPVHKIQISKDRKRFFTAQVLRNGAWERTFTEKRYLLPIPQGHLDKRAASGIIDEQNPMW